MFVRRNGVDQPTERDQGDMRAFERVMHTRWNWRISQVVGNDVTVELTESNDFYDALGLGQRSQTTVYSVERGKIFRTETTNIRHARGGEYRPALAKFMDWLMAKPAAGDVRIVRGRELVFDAGSARALRPWLKRYPSR